MKLRKWEKDFNSYDKQKTDEKIVELEALSHKSIVGNGTNKFNDEEIKKIQMDSKEAKKELKVLKAIRSNIDKVAIIIKEKEKLVNANAEIEQELKAREKMTKLTEEAKKIEEELAQITEKLDEVNSKLKGDLKDEDRKALEEKRSKLHVKKVENNNKFVKNQADMAVEKNSLTGKLKDKTVDELQEMKSENGKNIGKCNFVGNLLMQGKSWDYIQVKHQENRRYTSEEKLSNKQSKVKEENVKKVEISKENEAEVVLEEVKSSLGENVQAVMEEEKETKALVEVSEFEKKHPRMAKIGKFFSNIIAKVLPNKETQEELVATSVEEKDNKNENNGAETKKVDVSVRDEFMEYLRKASENVKDDNKLEEAKRQAHARETKKFGKDYADRSVKIDDENEIG